MPEFILFIIEDLAIVLSVLMMIFLVNQTLKYHQGSSYRLKDGLRYFKSFYTKHYYYLLLIPFIFILDKWYMQLIYLIYLITLYLFTRPKAQISKLVYTSRIWRLCGFIIIFYTALGTILMMNIAFKQLLSLMALYISIMPILTYFASLLMYPIEKLINKFYHIAARRKLKKFQPLVIGITGSSGKTSVKNYIYELLRNSMITYMSPKSYNTLNGLSMTINEYLGVKDAVLVLEMGATKLGDIEELVNFVPVDIAVITQITSQHLQTFISIENIINEKMKLVKSLNDKGIAILNYDCKEIRNYQVKSKGKIITIGTTADCDYYAKDIEMDLDGIRFICVYDNKEMVIKSKLVGRYNVNNILAAIAVARVLHVHDKVIEDGVSLFSSVPHRLEVKKDNVITVIDDSYNSNPLGFKMALEVLNLAQNKKTIITPGIVEAGQASEAINYDLAIDIAKVCDEVILIDNQASKYIHQGLINNNFENIHVVNSFKSAYALVSEGTVLIENDLPDNYFI